MRKNNGTYYVAYRDQFNKQRTKSFGSGTEGKRAAEAFNLEVKAKKLRREEIVSPRTGAYLDELAQMWIDAKKAEGKGGRWLRDWVNILNRHLLADLTRVPVGELSQDYILKIILRKYPDSSQTTRNRYLSYLKVMFNFGVEHHLVERNPLDRWKKAKEAPRASTLTVEQLKRIKATAVPHIAWAIEVAFNLGVRTGPSELLALKWANVDWDSGMIRVYATKTKSWRTIPMSESFLRTLKEQHAKSQSDFIVDYNGKQIRSIKKGFRNACRRAGIDDSVITYDMRHLYATTLLNKGGDLASVSKLMGHASTKMTADQYYHTLASEKIRTVRLLPKL